MYKYLALCNLCVTPYKCSVILSWILNSDDLYVVYIGSSFFETRWAGCSPPKTDKMLKPIQNLTNCQYVWKSSQAIRGMKLPVCWTME